MKLDERFRSLDRTSIPDVWTEATSRATHQDDHFADLIETRRRRIPRVVAAVLVVAVFLWAFIGLERGLKTGSQASRFAPGQIARYPVPDPQSLAYGGGSTWVLGSAGGSSDEVYRIDAGTGVTTPLPETRGAQSVAFGSGYAWAPCFRSLVGVGPCPDPIVMKIDPSTGGVIDTIPIPRASSSIVTGFGAVWVANWDAILRIDPNSDQIIGTFTGITHVAQIAVGGGSVWGSSFDGSKNEGKIVGLDPTSGAVVASVPFPDPCLFTAGSEGVYVAGCGGGTYAKTPNHLTRIDPTTGRVGFTVPLPRNAAGWMTLFDGRLWVGAAAGAGTGAEVIPLDPASGLPLGDSVEVPVSGKAYISPSFHPRLFLAGGADSLWVTPVDANDVIRIGVAGPSTSSGIDPTVAAELASSRITVTSASDSSAVSADSAVTAAGSNFGFVGSVTPTASLVRFTDLGTGPHADHGNPLYSNTEAWMVVYRGIQMPVHGFPLGVSVAPEHLTHPADFVVFVDAHTGQYLTAVGIGT